jgi:two-component system, sensor histidine kinase YesM
LPWEDIIAAYVFEKRGTHLRPRREVNLMARIRTIFSNTSLRIKLLLIFFSFLIALGTAQGIYLYLQSSQLIVAQERDSDQLELKQLSDNLDGEFNEMDIITKNLVYRSTVQEILKDDNRSPGNFLDVTHQRAMLNAIDTVIVSYYYRFQSIYIYNRSGNFYGGPDPSFTSTFHYSELKNSEFYHRILSANGKMVTGPRTGGNEVAIGRLINNPISFTPIGVLVVIVKLDSFHNYYNEMGNQGDTLYMLYDQDGHSMNKDQNAMPSYNEILSHPDKTMDFQGGTYIVSTNRLANSNWVLVKLTSKASLLKSVGVLKETTVMNVLVVIAFFIPLSMFISSRITKPIQTLSNLMQGTIKKNFNNRAKHDSNDEIGRLSKAYNFMIDEINSLIQKEFVLELVNKENELKMLQSQINPHFLYNTLDTINWAARMNGIQDVGELAESLAKLMRIAIRNDGPGYTVEDEIDYITHYLTIQRYRYEDRIQVILDIDPDVMDCRIPKLIIQPLLENAIVHNMEANEEPTRIQLSIRKENDSFLHIQIDDNGVGFPEDRLSSIMKSFTEHAHGTSHGLINVHRRILLNNRQEDGLHITNLTRGTSIYFQIQLERRMEQHVQAADLR